MEQNRLGDLEKKIHSLEQDTLKSMSEIAKEIHGLTVELRYDREDRNKSNDRIRMIERDLVDIKISQAAFSDFKAVMGKGFYAIFAGVVSIIVGGVIAAVKIASMLQSSGLGG